MLSFKHSNIVEALHYVAWCKEVERSDDDNLVGPGGGGEMLSVFQGPAFGCRLQTAKLLAASSTLFEAIRTTQLMNQTNPNQRSQHD